MKLELLSLEHSMDNMDIDMNHIPNKYPDQRVFVMYTWIDLRSLLKKYNENLYF
jgi:hypothetical protein